MPDTGAPHNLPYPSGSDDADVPGDMAALANQVDARLDLISPSQITGVSAGKILVANGSGVVTAVSPTGDVSISNAGVIEIGAGKVGTPELADGAVTTAKHADDSVTRVKVPKSFIQTQRATFINLAANSILEVTLTWDVTFGSLNYTPTVSIFESNNSLLGLGLIRISSKSATAIKVMVANNSSGTASGAVNAIGIAD